MLDLSWVGVVGAVCKISAFQPQGPQFDSRRFPANPFFTIHAFVDKVLYAYKIEFYVFSVLNFEK